MSRGRHKGKSTIARASGVGVATDLVSGNPNVVKEAREKRKRGGKVMVEGPKAMRRMDRATRKGGTDATTAGGLYSSASKTVAKARGT